MSEKEDTYRKVGALREERKNQALKIAALRREIANLYRASSFEENAALRAEAKHYRKALTNIAHRLEGGPVAERALRSIVWSALNLRMDPGKRERIARVHGQDGAGEQ